MTFKALALALPLLALHTGVLAKDKLEKNGLPCVAELCLGDTLADLSKIQWTPAQGSYKINNKAEPTASMRMSEDKMRDIKDMYPFAGEAAPYLHANQFDSGALAALAKVTSACQPNELIGTYGGKGSAPTRVGISLTPVPSDPNRQVWTVTTIVREFPSAVTNEERAEITKQLTRRYNKFGAGNPDTPTAKAGEGRFFPSGMTRFGFGLSLARAADEAERMRMHPSCSATAGTGDKQKSS